MPFLVFFANRYWRVFWLSEVIQATRIFSPDAWEESPFGTKAMGWVPDQTTLGFAFRWHKLKGRRLTAWANPYSDLREGGVVHDETIESCVQFSAVSQFVEEATKRLFAAFEGTTIPRRTIEDLVKRLFERKLGL
jgi:hypothetical protein